MQQRVKIKILGKEMVNSIIYNSINGDGAKDSVLNQIWNTNLKSWEKRT